MAVQRLRLYASTAGGTGSILVGEPRFQMPWPWWRFLNKLIIKLKEYFLELM